MKKILLILFLAGICGAITAQKGYTINPSRTLTGTAYPDINNNFDIYLMNIANKPVTVKWKLLSDKMIKGWDYSCCAYGTCYTGFPDTLGTMKTIESNLEDGFLAVNVDPHYIEGTGIAKFILYDINAPTEIDTIVFIINAETSNGINKYAANNALKIYPNPASESITVKVEASGLSNASIQINDLLGNTVYNTSTGASDLNVIDVSFLSKGIYFVRYNYGNGTSAIKKLQLIN